MPTWLILVLIVILLKIAINLSKWLRCARYRRRYVNSLGTDDRALREARSQVTALVKGAGLTDAVVPFVEFIGYGQLSHGNASVLANFPSALDGHVQSTIRMLDDAIGVYRTRALEALNPLFWIEFVIKLPQNALSYLGVPPEALITRILQVLYWILCLIAGLLHSVLKPDMEHLVGSWIELFRR
jgi:hypothetical protein